MDVEKDNEQLPPFEFNRKTVDQRLIQQSYEEISQEIRRKRRRKRLSQWALAIAIFLIGFPILYYTGQQPVSSREIVVQSGSQNKQVQLPDGSSIMLAANSTLRYPEHWKNQNRRIRFSGKGFFDIKKLSLYNDLQPFTIEAEDGLVEVLGTSFTLDAGKQSFLLALNEGKVRAKIGNDVFELLPNQMIRHYNGNIQKSDINASLYGAWRTGLFTCNNTRLVELIEVIKASYNIEVVILDPSIEKILVNGTIEMSDQQVFFSTISELFGIKTTTNEDTVRISR